ncbi:hypothetical protein KY330_05360 [Candidatus Woesearchaeota archaeon]|nr:hypothetical protein [Candidatus Woesearchaeota archaeon]
MPKKQLKRMVEVKFDSTEEMRKWVNTHGVQAGDIVKIFEPLFGGARVQMFVKPELLHEVREQNKRFMGVYDPPPTFWENARTWLIIGILMIMIAVWLWNFIG